MSVVCRLRLVVRSLSLYCCQHDCFHYVLFSLHVRSVQPLICRLFALVSSSVQTTSFLVVYRLRPF